MLMKAKAVLIFMVAVWAFSSALQNTLDWQGTMAAVNATTSMVTIEGGDSSWKATSQPLIVWLGALFIMLCKVATAALCGFGGLKMWRQQNKDIEAFYKAKNIALTGCIVAIVMLFGGFIVIAEGWFELWRSESLRAPVIESAFRYACMISLAALIVATPDTKP
jgi:predicted small integral membrane protein